MYERGDSPACTRAQPAECTRGAGRSGGGNGGGRWQLSVAAKLGLERETELVGSHSAVAVRGEGTL
jgi:hypothetical protein